MSREGITYATAQVLITWLKHAPNQDKVEYQFN
jgi:hypothetical protein